MLIIAHSPSQNTKALESQLIEGAKSEVEGGELLCKSPFDCHPPDLVACRGVLLFTTENFGYMSGAMKDFFDRNFYPLEHKTEGLPWALCVRAGKDGTGTVRSISAIAGALGWKQVAEPLVLQGDFNAGPGEQGFPTQAFTFAATFAAGLAMNIF